MIHHICKPALCLGTHSSARTCQSLTSGVPSLVVGPRALPQRAQLPEGHCRWGVAVPLPPQQQEQEQAEQLQQDVPVEQRAPWEEVPLGRQKQRGEPLPQLERRRGQLQRLLPQRREHVERSMNPLQLTALQPRLAASLWMTRLAKKRQSLHRTLGAQKSRSET